MEDWLAAGVCRGHRGDASRKRKKKSASRTTRAQVRGRCGRSVPHRSLSGKPRKGSCSRDPSEDVPRSTSAPDMFRRNRTGDVRSAMGMAGFSASSSDGSVRTFQLSPSSVLKIQKGDITVWSVDGSTDAIVSIEKPP
ncbi:hypothetical protein ZIOFF_007847 [Zingiber officinale]|uniref:Uncharacterized protein n=1 Tax=Zingiber officinale TaxID=94328 RepID=A0A8J5M645_ZINOF|nr:hypothetical protein ZIOFF_007847 [Zingiber officinale]